MVLPDSNIDEDPEFLFLYFVSLESIKLCEIEEISSVGETDIETLALDMASAVERTY